jgi:hypothetical protein
LSAPCQRECLREQREVNRVEATEVHGPVPFSRLRGADQHPQFCYASPMTTTTDMLGTSSRRRSLGRGRRVMSPIGGGPGPVKRRITSKPGATGDWDRTLPPPVHSTGLGYTPAP